MFELGCKSVKREDGTYFSTIYNNDLPISSPYAALVVNATNIDRCNELTEKLIAFVRYWNF